MVSIAQSSWSSQPQRHNATYKHSGDSISGSRVRAHLEAPPASRNAPSAEKASDVKHWPEVRLAAARRSDARRPPATSRRPSIVPWLVLGAAIYCHQHFR